ncbi:MAG: hypothetical protein R2752_14225 [Vicinamibacterales bacterium]
MPGFWTPLTVPLLTLSLVAPAAVPATVSPVAPSPAGRPTGATEFFAPAGPSTPSLRQATRRAASFMTATTAEPQTTPRAPLGRPASRRIRAQGGGGTAVMLISTIIGLAGTVYLVKYMKDQNKNDQNDSPGSFGR